MFSMFSLCTFICWLIVFSGASWTDNSLKSVWLKWFTYFPGSDLHFLGMWGEVIQDKNSLWMNLFSLIWCSLDDIFTETTAVVIISVICQDFLSGIFWWLLRSSPVVLLWTRWVLSQLRLSFISGSVQNNNFTTHRLETSRSSSRGSECLEFYPSGASSNQK